ncbi:glutamate--tRNA ligase [Candidatus Sumerlaeota bacterium]|nr:glutamate--tRNA ligase [Candidatus Sumerlaeota bacterium]
MSNTNMRLRFAPSPTGYLHVGGARAALFNYLYAKHLGGKFLLRIEDTDLERSTPEVTEQIIRSLKWLGLNYDEAPVYQTANVEKHRAAIEKLLASGALYKSYCPKERLEDLRAQANAKKQPFIYRESMLDEGEAERYKNEGKPFVVRFRCPLEGITSFDDLVYGHIEVRNELIGDFVVARGDGSPLFMLSNVVDDIEMGVNLVCRGEDHVSNVPKQILLYKALGAEVPTFAHLPLILGPDKKKLSKRHGATGVDEFTKMGILPDAMFNFLALLGWAPSGDAEFDEIMSREELIEKFTLEKVNRAGAVFDYDKLLWMNGVYIRKMPFTELLELIMPKLNAAFPEMEKSQRNTEMPFAEWLNGIIGLEVERSRSLNDFEVNLAYFFNEPNTFDEKASRKFLGSEEQRAAMQTASEIILKAWDEAAAKAGKDIEAWGHNVEQSLRVWSDAQGMKFGNVAQPIRLAMTGKTASPPLFHIIWYLGKEQFAKRIATCLSTLNQ